MLVFTLILSACASATPSAMPAATAAPVIPITGQSPATMAPVASAMPMATATMAPAASAMLMATATMAPVASAMPVPSATMMPPAMSSEIPAAIYQKAQQIDNRATVLALGLKMRNDVPIYAITGTPSSPATVNRGQNSSLDSFLVDSKGMTLYIFTNDSPNMSSCYSTCATYWPPLLTNGPPVAGTGVTASMLGTTTRTDGTVQVTYNGWPLYDYSLDKAAGDTNGQGFKSLWYVITPNGMQWSAALPAATDETAPSGY
jgi:predicted lipoprotein with Yx(FWY)xxD motif